MSENERFIWNEGILGSDPWRDKVLYGGLDEIQRDLLYMREMYPQPVRALQDAVTEELDLMDNSRSFIYDEYPDKYLLYRLVSRVIERYMNQEGSVPMEETVIRDITTILVLNEIYRRRRKKWW